LPGLNSSNEQLQTIPASPHVATMGQVHGGPAPQRRHQARHDQHHPSQVDRILEENRRLMAMMEEKDRRICMLEAR